MATYDVLVIGGGIVGLSTLYHLTRRGAGRVGLVERFRVGHARGSSHGAARITRSTYEDEVWVRLVRFARREEWPRLETDAGTRLVHPAQGCFFGPAGETLDAYLRAVSVAGDDVERLDPAEGRHRFPLFRFPDAAAVLHDKSAGLVAAADTLEALVRVCAEHAEILEDTRVLAVEPGPSSVVVRTSRGDLEAGRVVLAAGPWTTELVPALRARLSVARQTVCYFSLDAPEAAQRLPAFPVWAHLGDERGNASVDFYGLPRFGAPGVKAAHHGTCGAGDDPNDEDPALLDSAVQRVRDFLDEQLAVPVRALEHAEHCLYTNTATEDFVLDRHPDDERIVVGAGFSGHGFKFGPLVGRILAELCLDGATTVPPFESARSRFRCHPGD